MEEKVSRYTLEFVAASHERSNRRLWIALLVSILLGVASNAFWIYERFQYESVSEYSSEVTAHQELNQDSGDGGSNYSYFYGGDNGKAEDHDNGDEEGHAEEILQEED